jgi:K+-dependent Na+/Ca+ exchanger-like protein
MSIIFALIILLGAFYILAVLTEEFFVPAIDILSKKLKLSSDASGATLLAMGSSAPEFFTSFIAIVALTGSDHADIGAGTIVGSAIFNVLVIVGAAAMFKAVQLQWKPVLRDLAFYIFTILMLLWAFMDGKIVLYEAVSFVAMYVFYVFIVVNWQKWLKYKEAPLPEQAPATTSNKLHRYTHAFIGFVVPDPAKRPKAYIATFVLSILAIAGLSWLLVEQVLMLADILNINATFLALTVLAAGTSVPDLIGSIVVAKQGRGDMAVSNAIGSNIFDVLFCLGFPWLLVLSFRSGEITVGTENLTASVFLLFATVVATLFILVVRNWRIGHKSGLGLIGLYVAYCIYIALTVA